MSEEKYKMKKLFCALALLLAFANLHSKELADVASGLSHTLLLFKDGTIVSLGYNYYGQLGRETEDDELSGIGIEGKRVSSDKKFISVAAGFDHSIAVSDDGILWGWGSDMRFQLGLGVPGEMSSWHEYRKPVQLDDTKKWKKVFADGNISIGMTSDGKLWNISRGCGEIEHPSGAKWKDVRIVCFAEWDGSDYSILLKDEKNCYWLYKFALFSPHKPYTLFFDKNKRFGDDADDHLGKGLHPLIKPTDFFYMNEFSGIFKDGKKFNVWGFSAIEPKISFDADGEIDDSIFTKITEKQIQVDDKNIKKILCGKFLPDIPYLMEIGKGLDNPECQVANGPYAAFFYEDGTLRLFADGNEYKIGKEKGIKKVFGGYNIIFQTKDDRIFFIGYNLYDSMGDYDSNAPEDESEMNFFFCKEIE